MTKLLLLTLIGISVVTCLTTGPSDEPINKNVSSDDPDESRRTGFVLIRTDPEVKPEASYQVNVLPESIECYSCIDCPEILPNTTTKLCPVAYGSKQSTCVVFAEQYRQVMKTYYIRGCATERGSCAEISRVHSRYIHNEIVDLKFCDECEGDKCNTSGAGRSTLSIALLTTIVYFSRHVL